jgi:multiple sugar transport system ATP-binding protein
MGDRIVVMSAAEVQQVGTPADVYYNPANLFVARFIGSPGMNLVEGVYNGGTLHLPGGNQFHLPEEWRNTLLGSLGQGGKIVVGFRPEAVTVHELGVLLAQVYADDLYGAYSVLHLSLDGENPETVIHARADRNAEYQIDTPLRFDLDLRQVRFFNPQTEQAIPVGALSAEVARV